MARTDVPLTNLSANTGIAEPAGTAVDPTNGHSINVAGLSGRLLIWINNTFAGTKVFTVKAGATNPPAVRGALGDLAYTAAASARAFVGPLESARFIQADGKIYVDVAASTTGTIAALFLPFHTV